VARSGPQKDAEREKFLRLQRKVEAIRLRCDMSKTALAAQLQTTTDTLRAWATGRTVGRKETRVQAD
jgi:DNA-binding transcriptional regulator YiaG